RGIVDGTIDLYQRRQELLGFSGASITPADADFLARWRGRDLEPRGARKLDDRIGVRIVHPARTAIKGNIERRAVRETAAADLSRSLDHDHLAARRLDTPRCGNAGSTRADHDDIRLARGRSCEGRPVKHRGRR